MKICPRCNQTYDDDNLNFCLNDGELLMETESIDAPPTIMMDAPRQTNDDWNNYDTGFANQSQVNPQNREIYRQPFANPQVSPNTDSKDQILPIISLSSGVLSIVLSFCCYLGILIGPIALITGFIGMSNANKTPGIYQGKNLAVIGMILGGVGLVMSIIMLILGVALSFF